MHDIAENTEQIERYLSSEITTEERAIFEESLASDKELLEQTILVRKLKEDLLISDREKIREEFQEMMADSGKSTQHTKVRSLNKTYYWAAASITVLLVSFWWIFNSQSPEELFAVNYQPFPMSQVMRDAGGEEVTQGISLYSAGKYQDAVNEFLKSSDPKAEPEKIRLAIACSYLSLNEPDQAIEWLNPLTASANIDISEASNWYLALSYLKLEEIDKSKEILTVIAASRGVWSGKSKLLLAKL